MAICLNSGIHMIIHIVTYILLPLIVAYITTVMTKREEVELDAQGQLLEHRVQAYAEVYRFMRKSLNRIAVPFVEEKLYADCLEDSMYKIGRQGMEYASFLSSIENIDKYSDQLERLLLTNSLYWIPNLRVNLIIFSHGLPTFNICSKVLRLQKKIHDGSSMLTFVINVLILFVA